MVVLYQLSYIGVRTFASYRITGVLSIYIGKVYPFPTMCGIIGYTGSKNATPLLIEGLEALEYRGYDSAGVYVEGQGVLKRAGKVTELKNALSETFTGTTGIAHTRWATHGAPTEANAHPHQDQASVVFVTHNGIIENYAELKAELVKDGATFTSETDTEVLASWIGKKYTEGTTLEKAVAAALKDVRGAYGLAVASTREPGKLVAARLSSPVMIGIGQGENFIASDATPILKYTREVIYLDDGEIAVLTPEGYAITTLDLSPVQKGVETLEWDVEAAQKKGYAHFMLKEMMEIPEAIENTLRGRILFDEGNAKLGGLRDILPELLTKQRLMLTACGSASYAARVGELLIEELAGIPVEVELGSELRYRKNTMRKDETALLAVSQSGETLDTIEALREAKRHGLMTLGVVNVVGSSIARETDAGVYNHAGPEISVASTKAVLSQMTVLSLIALTLARAKGLSQEEGTAFVKALSEIPALAREVLNGKDSIQALAHKYKDVQNAFFLGRKYQYPVAAEGAIKLKEVSYIHAEGYASGEMKHGPIALIEPSFLSIILAPKDSLFEKSKSNIQEIRSRGGQVIAITTHGAEDELKDLADDIITVPETLESLLPILTTIPLQLFAYYVALARGLPIDQPRNLAKSVTVE